MSLNFNYSSSAFRICVDQVSGHYLSGRIAGQRLKAPVAFSDVNQLLSQLDAVMDSQQFPQAFQRIRAFSDKAVSALIKDIPVALSTEEMLSEERIAALRGEKATFLLHITMRRNASWQGFVDWMDGSPRQKFDSTLEFLNALDQHLSLWSANN